MLKVLSFVKMNMKRRLLTNFCYIISECGVSECRSGLAKKHGVSMKDFDLLKVLGTGGKKNKRKMMKRNVKRKHILAFTIV